MSWSVLPWCFSFSSSSILLLLFPAWFDGSQAGNGFPVVGMNASQERCGLDMNEAQEVVQDVKFTQHASSICSRAPHRPKPHPPLLGVHIQTLSSNLIKECIRPLFRLPNQTQKERGIPIASLLRHWKLPNSPILFGWDVAMWGWIFCLERKKLSAVWCKTEG